jgi:hypothetical protein
VGASRERPEPRPEPPKPEPPKPEPPIPISAQFVGFEEDEEEPTARTELQSG